MAEDTQSDATTETRKRLLVEHFSHLHQRLIQYADHAGIASHGDVIGAAREGFLKIFLEQNLPCSVEFKTGQIIDEEDTFSGQVDLYLQSTDAPRIFLDGDLQLGFIDAVIGAIEVKSNLKTAGWDQPSHLKSAFELFRKIKALKRNTRLSGRLDTGRTWSHANTPCFLVAYKGPPIDTLREKIASYSEGLGLRHDEFCPEVCVVLDRSYALVRNDGWLYPHPVETHPFLAHQGERCLVDLFVYLSKAIQSWNAQMRPVNFANFFKGF